MYAFNFTRPTFKPQNRKLVSKFLGLQMRTSLTATPAAAVKINPTTSSKAVGLWLAGCSGMVAGAVLLGGITRLTESGLSMVNWTLIKEMKPPSNGQEWEEEFNRYKQSPEFQLVHYDFSLSDFKRIFYMEWGHRMWGRAIGLVYFLPLGYFLARGKIPRTDFKRHAVFSFLLLAQGGYGWYMVKSGLKPMPDSSADIPRVSQYRLAGHLSLAFILYSGYFWTALTMLKSAPVFEPHKNLKKLRIMTHMCKALVFFTAMSGAFVAGLDAGLIYNSFPKMGIYWVPPEILEFEPKWKNFFENSTTVQFDHRILGITTLTVITGNWVLSRFTKLPSRVRLAANCLAGMVWLQVTMGVTALLNYVPIWLASAHQCGSLVTLTFALWLSHELQTVKKLARKI